jgi:hypothetical protein
MALSENEIATDTVVIPSELKLKNPATPPVTVSLPIVARPSEVWNYLHGLLLLTGGLFALLLGVLFGMAVVGVGLRVANAGLSIWDVLLLPMLVPMIFAVWRGVGCTVAAQRNLLSRALVRLGTLLERAERGGLDAIGS